MRLLIRHSGHVVNERKFTRGPIYIGRQMGNQVFLPDSSVSRQHAVLYIDKNEKWILEDLDSANKTFLNKNTIHKCEVKNGDIIDISDFSIEVIFGEQAQSKSTYRMEDTIVGEMASLRKIRRKPFSRDSGTIKMPTKRLKDFAKAARLICKSKNLDELHRSLLEIILSQFIAMSAWVGLRTNPNGPIEIEGGRKPNSESITLIELMGHQAVAEAMKECKYVLIPQLPRERTNGTVRSVIVTPILRDNLCYGILYAENSTKHERYEMADVDYMVLLSIHAAMVMENFP